MKEIIVYPEEMAVGVLGLFGHKFEYPHIHNGQDVRRILNPHETMMMLANERAGVEGNLLKEGWVRRFNPAMNQHEFLFKSN